jgi:hypothetical protein
MGVGKELKDLPGYCLLQSDNRTFQQLIQTFVLAIYCTEPDVRWQVCFVSSLIMKMSTFSCYCTCLETLSRPER